LKPSPVGGSADRFPGLAGPRQRLDQLRVDHLTIAHRALEVADGQVFLPDLIVTAMLQRSYGVVDALIDAVDTCNMHAAAPLLRLQLDTLFRAHYVASGPDLDDLTQRLLGGEEFRKIKDADGKNLTDARLAELAREAHGWALPVYRETSGWVHFSVSHMKATVQVGDDDEFFMGVPLRPSVIPESGTRSTRHRLARPRSSSRTCTGGPPAKGCRRTRCVSCPGDLSRHCDATMGARPEVCGR
jgi:hypothetical protein